ncbi:hypothetical protein F2P44_31010 [Massilia sp. CCM 8695]|uniref:Uncharacterized protein n=1 Tax=Massilia frigida TaxID=2609281 RepID=A0ABX0NJM1_9BURK|nr:hypothetical protein [Massilia frigida]NHZ83663.1 hypothetical protein [Massilia frigida]
MPKVLPIICGKQPHFQAMEHTVFTFGLIPLNEGFLKIAQATTAELPGGRNGTGWESRKS